MEEPTLFDMPLDASTERILELARDGFSCSEIQRETGVHRGRVKSICEAHGVQIVNKQIETGQANQATYNERVRAGGVPASSLKHGAHSTHVKSLYDDPATPEGQELQTILERVVEPYGGFSGLTGSQEVELALMRPEFVVLLQLNRYIGRVLGEQGCLVDDGGKLPAVLDRNFLAYSNSLSRHLLRFAELGNLKPNRAPSVSEILGEAKG